MRVGCYSTRSTPYGRTSTPSYWSAPQAVYLRTASRIEGYQPFTTDADLVLNPTLLGPIPPLGEAMLAGGFVLTDEPGIWEARFMRPGFDDEIVVPVDLIVPDHSLSRLHLFRTRRHRLRLCWKRSLRR